MNRIMRNIFMAKYVSFEKSLTSFSHWHALGLCFLALIAFVAFRISGIEIISGNVFGFKMFSSSKISSSSTKENLAPSANSGSGKKLNAGTSGSDNSTDPEVTSSLHEFLQRNESGQKSIQDIEEEIGLLTNDGQQVPWKTKGFPRKFELVQVATHWINLNTQQQILNVHVLPHRKLSEHLTTFYSEKIRLADQKLVRSGIILAKHLSVSNGRPAIADKDRTQYYFSLRTDELAGTFGLSAPEGQYRWANPVEGAFDPLAVLVNADSQFEERPEYQFEKNIGPNTFAVTVTPLWTDLETLVFEIRIHELNSLASVTHYLVYESR